MTGFARRYEAADDVEWTTSRFAARADSNARWTLSGELDIDSVPVLVEFAAHAPAPTDGLELWIHELTFADAAGWRALHQIHVHLGLERQLRLVGEAGPVLLLLACCGVP